MLKSRDGGRQMRTRLRMLGQGGDARRRRSYWVGMLVTVIQTCLSVKKGWYERKPKWSVESTGVLGDERHSRRLRMGNSLRSVAPAGVEVNKQVR